MNYLIIELLNQLQKGLMNWNIFLQLCLTKKTKETTKETNNFPTALRYPKKRLGFSVSLKIFRGT